MTLVKQVRDSDLSDFKTPVLMFYSEGDTVVEPKQIRAAFARLGSQQKLLQRVDYSKSSGQHVLAGTIMDATAVAPLRKTIVQWLHNQFQQPRQTV
jgi:hypothetical protein